MKVTKGVTPVGEAVWCHVLSPEMYQGTSTNKYVVGLKLNEKDKKAFLGKIDNEWQKFVESEEGKKHTYKYDYANGLKEYKDDEYFKFKMTHIIRCKNGKDWERTVPVFDAGQKPIETEIGNGSKIKVAYELTPFYITSKNYGISLRMSAVQVLELNDANNESAESFGFAEEEGYHAEDAEKVDSPFGDAEDETEGDEF